MFIVWFLMMTMMLSLLDPWMKLDDDAHDIALLHKTDSNAVLSSLQIRPLRKSCLSIPIVVWFHCFWFIIFLEVDVQLLEKKILCTYIAKVIGF